MIRRSAWSRGACFLSVFLTLAAFPANANQPASQPAVQENVEEGAPSSAPASSVPAEKKEAKETEAYPATQPNGKNESDSFPSSQPGADYAASQPAIEDFASSQPTGEAFASSQPNSSTSSNDTTQGNAAKDALDASLPPAAGCPAKKEEAPPPSAQDYSSRPGASETTAVLPHGVMLIQTGVAFSSQLSGVEGRSTDNTLAVPEAQLRFGIFDWMEARFSTGYQVTQGSTADAAPVGSISGAATGVHIRVLDEGEYWPALALSGDLHLPTATLAIRDVEADVRLSFSKSFFDVVGVGSTLQAGWHSSLPTLDYTLAATMNLGDGVVTFIEVFGHYDAMPLALPSVWFDIGGSLAISNSVALDVYVGVNAMGQPSSYFLATGVSVLLPAL
ncbi:MAG: hypothetical protein GY822_16385 [Deltaproteobacteria bacterium]|nr:hypothetical protein [Deltaproteobacteria bacterium]